MVLFNTPVELSFLPASSTALKVGAQAAFLSACLLCAKYCCRFQNNQTMFIWFLREEVRKRSVSCLLPHLPVPGSVYVFFTSVSQAGKLRMPGSKEPVAVFAWPLQRLLKAGRFFVVKLVLPKLSDPSQFSFAQSLQLSSKSSVLHFFLPPSYSVY